MNETVINCISLSELEFIHPILNRPGCFFLNCHKAVFSQRLEALLHLDSHLE